MANLPIDDALYVPTLLGFMTLGGLALALRRRAHRLLIAAWLAAPIVGGFTGSMLTACGFYAFASYLPPLPELAGPGLSEGQSPMRLSAEGWLNGSAPRWDMLRGRVVVLDVWADW